MQNICKEWAQWTKTCTQYFTNFFWQTIPLYRPPSISMAILDLCLSEKKFVRYEGTYLKASNFYCHKFVKSLIPVYISHINSSCPPKKHFYKFLRQTCIWLWIGYAFQDGHRQPSWIWLYHLCLDTVVPIARYFHVKWDLNLHQTLFFPVNIYYLVVGFSWYSRVLWQIY